MPPFDTTAQEALSVMSVHHLSTRVCQSMLYINKIKDVPCHVGPRWVVKDLASGIGEPWTVEGVHEGKFLDVCRLPLKAVIDGRIAYIHCQR